MFFTVLNILKKKKYYCLLDNIQFLPGNSQKHLPESLSAF